MSKIDLNLDFDAIRERIDKEKHGIKPSIWADKVGVSRNVVTNIHGSVKQKPSLEYIVAVSKATNKSVDYYLWGTKETNKPELKNDIPQVIVEHQDLIKRYADPVQGKEINEQLIDIQDTDKTLFQSAVTSIKSIWDTAMTIRQVRGKKTGPEKNLKNGTDG